MSPKAPKKVTKITHIQLSKKAGERFNFAAPYETELQTQPLLAPRIETGKKTAYVDIPDFLEFKATKKNPVVITGDLAQLESIPEVIEATSSKESKTQENVGVFGEYFEGENIFSVYKRKALYKSILFGALSLFAFSGIILSLVWSSLFTILLVSFFAWVFVQSFVTMCLLATDRLVITLVALTMALGILFTSASIGLFGIVPLACALVSLILLLVSSKEIERLQVISRILEYPRIVRAARGLLITFLAILVFFASSHFAEVSSLSSRFESLIPQKLVTEQVIKNSVITTIYGEFNETKSFQEFTKLGSKTVGDVVLEYTYKNSTLQVVSEDEYATLGVSPTMSMDEKNTKIQPLVSQRLNESLLEDYGKQLPLSQALTSTTYAEMVVYKWYKQVSDTRAVLPNFSNQFLAIPLSLGSVIYGLFFTVFFLVLYFVYIFLAGILAVLGLSLEKIWWWIVKKLKIIQVGVEKVESEVIIL